MTAMDGYPGRSSYEPDAGPWVIWRETTVQHPKTGDYFNDRCWLASWYAWRTFGPQGMARRFSSRREANEVRMQVLGRSNQAVRNGVEKIGDSE